MNKLSRLSVGGAAAAIALLSQQALASGAPGVTASGATVVCEIGVRELRDAVLFCPTISDEKIPVSSIGNLGWRIVTAWLWSNRVGMQITYAIIEKR